MMTDENRFSPEYAAAKARVAERPGGVLEAADMRHLDDEPYNPPSTLEAITQRMNALRGKCRVLTDRLDDHANNIFGSAPVQEDNLEMSTGYDAASQFGELFGALCRLEVAFMNLKRAAFRTTTLDGVDNPIIGE